MSLSEEERLAIVAYRKQKASIAMHEAEDVATLEHWNLVANRLYYACYYMASALLISKGFQAQTHVGVLRLIGLHFVNQNLLSREEGRLFSRLFDMRQTGDYDDMFDLSREDVTPYINPAKELIRKMELLIGV
ncbi:MAG: HEPN domain-containing protein [Prevotellaceae bacterium]|jgi:uncharacterized protein (UPF0332 family)|nr:HEPN domain-containing protein [Prevotellaceae bacterium]